MMNLLKIELLTLAEGAQEFIYSVAEKVDYRMKSFKISFLGKQIERELDSVYKKIGKTGIEKFMSSKNWTSVELSDIRNEFLDAQILKERYSQTLEDLYLLRRKALKDLLSDYTALINKTGWEMAQIPVPDEPFFNGKSIREFQLKEDSLILMVKKDTVMEIAHGNTLLQGGDILISVGTAAGLNYLRNLFSSSSKK